MRAIWAYWGYLAAAALIVAWGRGAATGVILVLSLAVFAYAAFQTPVWCGAVNRGGGTYCRRNASGILMGCSLRQHRWQKIKLIVLRSKAGDVSRALFPTAKEKFGAFIALGGLASAAAAAVLPVFTG
ncbi:hypothetical protein [Streptomyces fructofermentans]|uniref:Uncharacterized protein n=1 Tax=Streptomyces fructofermentans TaxID=152141 RepID=A0A918NNJ6_9ACTN|nr:hypothetical protein [Streptomyces fructofermentans]GGX83382.1 hypothetical protein GCM10010515_58680 [Streptomyces fructofermentans]